MGLLDYQTTPPAMGSGLLAGGTQMDPRTMGLLQAGFAGLQASGPSRMPVSFGQVVGQAGTAGMNAMQQGQLQNQHALMTNIQIQEAQRNALARQRAEQAQAAFAASLPEGEKLKFAADPAGYIKHLTESPFDKVNPKDFTPESVAQFSATRDASKLVPVRPAHFADTGGSIQPLDPITGKPVGTATTKGMSPDASANLDFKKMEFGNLSANQKSQLKNELTRIGISEQQLAEGRVQLLQDNEGNVHLVNKLTGTGTTATKADGSPLIVQKPLTETQGKASLFGTRALEADKILNGLEGNISTTGLAVKRGAENIPLIGGVAGAVGNKMLSGDQQKVEQAQRNFVNAVLRVESGAAISDSEFRNAVKQYFPQPGDAQGVIEQKRANRATAIQGLQTMAGRGTPQSSVITNPSAAADPLGLRAQR